MLPAEAAHWLCTFYVRTGCWPTHASWHSTLDHAERTRLLYEPAPAPLPA